MCDDTKRSSYECACIANMNARVSGEGPEIGKWKNERKRERENGGGGGGEGGGSL